MLVNEAQQIGSRATVFCRAFLYLLVYLLLDEVGEGVGYVYVTELGEVCLCVCVGGGWVCIVLAINL